MRIIPFITEIMLLSSEKCGFVYQIPMCISIVQYFYISGPIRNPVRAFAYPQKLFYSFRVSHHLQQLKSTGDLVNKASRSRSNPQHCHAARLNLCSASILDNLSGDAQRSGLASKLEHLVLALDLHGDLGLAETFPALEDLGQGRVGGGAGEGLVACEGSVGALSSDFAYNASC
jgi:hypothetical protein